MKERTIKYLLNTLCRYENLEGLKDQIITAVNMIVEGALSKRTLFTCGNGGSACDAEHISGELLKGFKLKRPIKKETQDGLKAILPLEEDVFDKLQDGVKCIPLSAFNAFLTAFSNDCDGDFVFAQGVNVLGESDDILLAISTSGNSTNIVNAVKVAKAKGLKIISLTGKTGGKLKDLSDVLINVPEDETYLVQELHLPIYHTICLMVESELFDE